MSRTGWPWLHKLGDGLRNAFALAGPHGPLTEDDRKLLDKLAAGIVRRKMATPALLFLHSFGPLSGIGSQAMVFLRPFLTSLFRPSDYDHVAAILERRGGVGALVEAVEAARAKEEPQ